MKWLKSLLILILLMAPVVGWAFDPDDPADMKALNDTVAELKKCTPTDEQSLINLLDKNKSPDCWTEVKADPVKKTAAYFKGTLYLSDFINALLPKGVVITLESPLVIPDHVTFSSPGLIIGGIIGNNVPETPAQFIFDLEPIAGAVPTCAMTITNNVSFATSVSNAMTVNLEILPGKTKNNDFLHKDTALCIKGDNNILLGLTIGTNTTKIENIENKNYFVNGITIDGKSNVIGASKITTLTNGIVIKKEGNAIAENTITTQNSNCMAMQDQQCTGFGAFGGLVIDAYGSFIAKNTLTPPNTNVYFGYTDNPLKPHLTMETAANVLALNTLPIDNIRSNYVNLYEVMLGKSLLNCPGTVKIGTLEVKYQYLKTKDGLVVTCADGSQINPVCPTLSKVTGKCALTSSMLGCPAGTKITDGNICVPDYSAQGKLSCPDGTTPDVDGKTCVKTIEKVTEKIIEKPVPGESVKLPGEFKPIVANPGDGGGNCSLAPDQALTALTPVGIFLLTIGMTGLAAYRSSLKTQRVRGKRE